MKLRLEMHPNERKALREQEERLRALELAIKNLKEKLDEAVG